MLNDEELERRFRIFFKKYEDYYYELGQSVEELLEMNLLCYMKANYKSAYLNPHHGENLFFQIFSAINAYDCAINPYYQMMCQIEKEYGLDREIIDVGCGVFPALSCEIAKRQEGLDEGRITAIDPRVINERILNINLTKESFTRETKIEEGSLLVGRMPCEATLAMVDVAARTNSELYIQLCSCGHIPHDEITTNSSWYNYVCQKVISTLPNNFIFQEGEIVDPLTKEKVKIIATKNY